jgi:hypothetical protein
MSKINLFSVLLSFHWELLLQLSYLEVWPFFGEKNKNRSNSSTVQPEQHPHQQNQGYNTQDGNDTILNVISILCVTKVGILQDSHNLFSTPYRIFE